MTQVADMFMLDSLDDTFAGQTLNDGSPVAGSPVERSEVVGQQRSKFRGQSRTSASARIAQSAAGSPAQHRDNNRRARVSKRRIDSRTPSPTPPPHKRRPQRSEKARALPARKRLLVMGTSDSTSPRAAGSPVERSEVVGQQRSKFRGQSRTSASARIAQSAAGSPAQHRDNDRRARGSKRRIDSRTPSPTPPLHKRRPQRSEKARALPARKRLLVMGTSDSTSPRAAGSPAKQRKISRQATVGIAPRSSSPMAPSPGTRPRRSERVRALPARQKPLATRTSDSISPQDAGSPVEERNIDRQASSEAISKTSNPPASSSGRRVRHSTNASMLSTREWLLAELSSITGSPSTAP